ncbi:GlpM [Laribacter hongkongensis]|uniref:GlpM n=2 Tax=Laribacter hongkongensis TaxID=168471 RepID=A0A248LEH1_9NEIS|nr:GlpM [Laribacter hongkongensis]
MPLPAGPSTKARSTSRRHRRWLTSCRPPRSDAGGLLPVPGQSGSRAMMLLAKAGLGALAVLLIAWLSKSRHYYLAGLVPLFPTFALIAHAVVGGERGAAALKATALFGLAALVPYAGYLLAVWLLAGRLSLLPVLLAATVVWLVLAWCLVAGWSRLMA